MAVKDLRVMGRATQGVRLINLKGKDEIASVCKVMHEDEEDIEFEEDITNEEGIQNEGNSEESETPSED